MNPGGLLWIRTKAPDDTEKTVRRHSSLLVGS